MRGQDKFHSNFFKRVWSAPKKYLRKSYSQYGVRHLIPRRPRGNGVAPILLHHLRALRQARDRRQGWAKGGEPLTLNP